MVIVCLLCCQNWIFIYCSDNHISNELWIWHGISYAYVLQWSHMWVSCNCKIQIIC